FLTGGRSFYEMELFAKTRRNWLKKMIHMTSIPSHDTFNRIFQSITPENFTDFLINITKRLRKEISGEIVAFDGKTHCGTASENITPLHMLNAWAVQNRLVLGQLAVPEKSNEITAMPQLMDILDLQDCIVTSDALTCQKNIAGKTIEKKSRLCTCHKRQPFRNIR
ncbi:ISAs1 family transposase, partial [Desulfovibrio sp. SGI.169]|uniref:ISAs1 family transposase n=1 Tax=Desulfovibrio sp. SGI.169 TaxID=3420561 RepID=UPI003D017BFE